MKVQFVFQVILLGWLTHLRAVGHSLADVVYGKVNPAGRLPLTLPLRIEDSPSFGNTRCEQGKIHYREDLLVGYKHYVARNIKPLFPFG
jgi:beta-glucosidase